MNNIEDPKLEAERLRREAYLERFGLLPTRKERDTTLEAFNKKNN